MARLTWQDVAAPNLSAAIQGMSAAGDALNQGFNNIRATANTVDGSISNRVNSALQMQMLGAKNAEEVQAILAGADPRRVNSSSINMAAERPGQIIDLALKDLGLKRETLGFERSEDRYARNAAAEDDLKTYWDLERAGKRGEAQAFLQDNADIRGLKIEDYLSGLGTGDRFGDDKFGRTVRDYNQNRSWEDDKASDEAEKLYASAMQSGNIQSIGDAIDYVRTAGVSNPKVYNILASKFGFPGLMDDVSGAAGGGGGGLGGGGGGANGGDPYNVVFGFDKFTQPPKALTDMTMGEVYDYGQKVLRPETRAAGFGKTKDGRIVGTSAVGAYQFVGGTMEKYAKRLFGEGWRTAQFTPEAQDAMAEALFNDTKGGNLKATWEGLPDSRPGAYKNKTWPEMRDLILRYESGGAKTSPRDRDAINYGTDTAAEQAYSDVTADPLMKSYFDAIETGQGVSIDAAAAKLTATGGIFEGVSRDTIAKRLQTVKSKAAALGFSNMNSMQAAAVLENSLGEQAPFAMNWLSNTDVGGRAIDMNLLESNILTLKNGGAESARNAARSVQAGSAERDAAFAQLQKAEALRDALVARRANPGRIAAANQAVSQAEAAWLGTANRHSQPGASETASRSSGIKSEAPAAPTKRAAQPAKNPRATLPSQSYRPPVGQVRPLPKLKPADARRVSRAQSLFDLYQ